MITTAVKPARFPWYRYDRYSFSLGVQRGDRTYLSGHTASEHDAGSGRMAVRGGMGEQARTAWAKIGAILEAAGQTLDDVVRVVEYVTEAGIERYAEAAAVREELLGSARPAVNTVLVKRLLRPEAFIEIEVTAGPEAAGRPHPGRGSLRASSTSRRSSPWTTPDAWSAPATSWRRRARSTSGPAAC